MYVERRERGERGKRFRLTGGCFGRPCSRSFPLNSSASGTESGEKSTQGERENGGMGEWSRRMMRESAGEGKRFA